MYTKYSPQWQAVMDDAEAFARKRGKGYIGAEDLLIGLLRNSESVAGAFLREEDISEDELLALLADAEPADAEPFTRAGFFVSPKTGDILDAAEREAAYMGTTLCGTEHILIALLRDGDNLAVRLLNILGDHAEALLKKFCAKLGFSASELSPAPSEENRQPSVLLDFSKDLCQEALLGKFDPLIGREKEMSRVLRILCRRTKNNPCLTGEPGVGKTALVQGLASRFALGNVPEALRGYRLLSLDLAAMVAGTKFRGEFEDRLKKCLDEVKSQGNIILFVDEIHTLVGAGSAEGSLDAANIMKPALSSGELQLIGSTTPGEYSKYIEKDKALERRFQPVLIEEPSEDDCIAILKGLSPRMEAHHNVSYSDEAVSEAVRLSARYINDRFLPDKAIDVLDEAGARVRMNGAVQYEEKERMQNRLTDVRALKEAEVLAGHLDKARVYREEEAELVDALREGKKAVSAQTACVSAEDIASIIADWTKIPVSKLSESDNERLKKLEEQLHERVIGQDEAVNALAKAIRRGRMGFKDPGRPIGSFLFLGPTGVGKTELCKALAETLFGDEKALIRLDMSEYMEKESASKIIGSAPGYIGYEEGGQLAEKIRRHPYSVVLFDEIEKAHPDVFNILLQVLDEGHITDSHGRSVDFKNTVIILTSNVGARSIVAPKSLGFSADKSSESLYEAMQRNVMEEVKRLFRPEFLNRIDETLVFRQLNSEEVRQIAELLFKRLVKRTEEALHIGLRAEGAALDELARLGFDPAYGARPLRRTIQDKVENLLADAALNASFRQGDEVVLDFSPEKGFFLI